MSKFKVGDRIRVLRLHPYSTDITVGETYQVKEVFSDGDIYITDDVGDLNRIASKNVEPVYSSNPAAEVDNIAAEYGSPKAWFKAGERVRYVGKSSEFVSGEHVGKTGKVTWISESGFVSVDFDDGTDQNGCYPANLEHVAAEPATATAATGIALRIEAGKFYKTRDGRKVGPMERDTLYRDGHWYWRAPAADGEHSPYWAESGSFYVDRGEYPLDLIAEWTDEPVAAPAAKFNVGDKVRIARSDKDFKQSYIGNEFTITHSECGSDGRTAWIGRPGSSPYIWFEDELEPAVSSIADIVARHSQTGTAIVCLLENGKPAPATRPFVHTNPEAAATEADRLANAHKGQEFGVYTLGEVRKVQKVYDFGWQNLAMSGRKIEAIKNLRADNGLTLKGAKDAVEHWVASQAA